MCQVLTTAGLMLIMMVLRLADRGRAVDLQNFSKQAKLLSNLSKLALYSRPAKLYKQAKLPK